VEKTVNAKGHFYFGFGIGLPSDYLKIAGEDYNQYLSIGGTATLMINYGNIPQAIQSAVTNLTNMNKSTGNNVLNNIIKAGAEIAIDLEGEIILKFASLTDGFIPNYVLDIEAAGLITLGNGDTGLPAGVYFSVSTTALTSIIDTVDGLLDNFAGILKTLGMAIPSPTVNADIDLGFFIQASMFGFSFSFGGHELTCGLKFSPLNVSCKFDNAFINALLKAGTWLINTAEFLFDNGGKLLMSVESGVSTFATNTLDSFTAFGVSTLVPKPPSPQQVAATQSAVSAVMKAAAIANANIQKQATAASIAKAANIVANTVAAEIAQIKANIAARQKRPLGKIGTVWKPIL